jgi:hypothetical protein
MAIFFPGGRSGTRIGDFHVFHKDTSFVLVASDLIALDFLWEEDS